MLTLIYIRSCTMMQAETEAKHESIFGSSPEPDDAAEDAYYARQENGSSDDEDKCVAIPPPSAGRNATSSCE